VIVAAVLLPLVYLLLRTIDAGGGAWDLLSQGRTLRILLRSALLAAAVVGTATLIAVPIAWLTVRTDLPMRKLWSVLTALPLVVPSYVGGFAFVSALGPRGLLQQVLEPLGVDRLPEIYGFLGAWLCLTLFTFPYILLSVRAALWGMDGAQEEASRSLGHGAARTFFRVTLPQLRPAIAAGGLLVALYTLSDFGAVTLLQFNSFTRVIYLQYEASFDRILASVLALMLVAFTMLILIVEQRARGRAKYHATSATRRLPLLRLGRWRWPALAFLALVVLASLGLPASVLLYWLAQGLANNVEVSFLGSAATNAVYASLLAAVVAVAASIPVTVLAVRYTGRFTRFLETASYAGFAMPGIVVALSLVFFGAHYAPALYQTLAMLVFAYSILYLSMAVGSVRASLLQVNPAVEEAARSLGRGAFKVLATVTLPLVRPGIVVAFAMVFLTAMKELPATLLLAPIGFRTLATEMWSATSSGFYAKAAIPALLLVGVSAIPVTILLRREQRGDTAVQS
jgi:iron(III) transport system permease protein